MSERARDCTGTIDSQITNDKAQPKEVPNRRSEAQGCTYSTYNIDSAKGKGAGGRTERRIRGGKGGE